MPNKFQIYKNFKANETKLNIKKAIKNLKIPQLIIQGGDDTVVLPQEAENMHQWNPKSELFIVVKMNHALGNTQPWNNKKLPNEMEIVLNKTIDFIKKKM